jgi:hypothetical protein
LSTIQTGVTSANFFAFPLHPGLDGRLALAILGPLREVTGSERRRQQVVGREVPQQSEGFVICQRAKGRRLSPGDELPR